MTPSSLERDDTLGRGGRVGSRRRREPLDWRGSAGQASVLLVGGLVALLVGVLVLGAVARGVAREAAAQRAADLAALAGATAMHEAYPRLFEPAVVDGKPNPRHLARDAYLVLGRAAADRTARANDAGGAAIRFPDGGSFAPVRIRVGVQERVEFRRDGERRSVDVSATATAEVAPPGADGLPAFADGGGYAGPLAYRQGKPMRPDVAQAFDRMERAARADGVDLLVTSGFRSDAEQAELFRRNPDPKWVAPPGTSLHRYGTELDLGPPAAYAWLAANAERFHFVKRYPHEPWHYGLRLRCCGLYGVPGGRVRGLPAGQPRRRPGRRTVPFAGGAGEHHASLGGP